MDYKIILLDQILGSKFQMVISPFFTLESFYHHPWSPLETKQAKQMYDKHVLVVTPVHKLHEVLAHAASAKKLAPLTSLTFVVKATAEKDTTFAGWRLSAE